MIVPNLWPEFMGGVGTTVFLDDGESIQESIPEVIVASAATLSVPSDPEIATDSDGLTADGLVDVTIDEGVVIVVSPNPEVET